MEEKQTDQPKPSEDEATSTRRMLLLLLVFASLIKLFVLSLAVPFGEFHPGLADLEAYQDFRLAYIPLVYNFTAGMMPYRDFHYAYPPLFLYLLAPFSLLPLPSWTMASPLLAFDVASVIVVFLISRRFMASREAFIASALYAVAPINLWYNDFLWLNPPPMTFFILLAVYAFLLEKYKASFAYLAVATLFKQIAFALFPIFTVALLRKSGRRDAFKNTVLYGSICFLGSLPYIITVPGHYLWLLGVPGFGPGWSTLEFKYYIGSPTSLAIALGENAYNPAKPLLWATLLLSFAVLCWRTYKPGTRDSMGFVTGVLYSLLLFHAFFPRGIYKYYYAAITPFYSIFVRNRKIALGFIGLNVLVLLIPRYLTPWFLLLLLVLLFMSGTSYLRIGRSKTQAAKL